jgi:hypothetical protein
VTDEPTTYTAFLGPALLASGALPDVLQAVKPAFDNDPGSPLLIFEDRTGRQVDFDLGGTLAEVLARYRPAPARTGPGRPRLGVVSREVSLLPRHWEWLDRERSGTSAAIRRLVDEARKRDGGEQQARLAIEAADRFLCAMAGNLPGYEEATRALYARDGTRFDEQTRDWPPDIRDHARRLVAGVFRTEGGSVAPSPQSC